MMMIGEFVRTHIGQIFSYCNEADRSELIRLMDARYSNSQFDLNYPFCAEVTKVSPTLHCRYWKERYPVRGKIVRVCNDWYNRNNQRNKTLFIQYLRSKNIASVALPIPEMPQQTPTPKPQRPNARFRGYPIGNAQNGVIRYVLSNIGQHSFSEADWRTTKSYFEDKCAYCGEEKDLVIDHAVPINRANLGEHRIGSLVPSCKDCNTEKGGDKDFREYLAGYNDRVAKIGAYMESRKYVSLGRNEQIKENP
jgi:5-methylcytosine-specific restriction endonuclease McrA